MDGVIKGVSRGQCPPNFGNKKSALSKDTQSRFVSVVLKAGLGPPCLMLHILRCLGSSVALETTHKAS